MSYRSSGPDRGAGTTGHRVSGDHPRNAAGRLAAAIEHVVSEYPGFGPVSKRLALHIWGAEFGLGPSAGVAEQAGEAVRIAGVLRAELASVQAAAARDPRLRPRTYERYLTAIGAALTPQMLFQPWACSAALLTDTSVAVLNGIADHLPEDALPMLDLTVPAILALITDVETAASRPGVPLELHSFLLDQVDALRIAVRDYHIRGPQALARAAHLAVFDWAQVPRPTTSAGWRALVRLRRAIAGVAVAAAAAGAFAGGANEVVALYDTVTKKIPGIASELGIRLPARGPIGVGDPTVTPLPGRAIPAPRGERRTAPRPADDEDVAAR